MGTTKVTDGLVSGNLTGSNAGGPSVIGDEAVSVTNPVFCPDKADETTGIGGADGGSNIAMIVGGAQARTINSDGSDTNILQPAFLGFLSAGAANVTGNGVSYTLVFDTEVFDQGSDFDGTSTFTFPVTGRYQVNVNVSTADQASGTNNGAKLAIVTSNGTYESQYGVGNMEDSASSGNCTQSLSIMVDADATDTMTCTIIVYQGSQNIDVAAGRNRTRLSVCLLT